MRLPAAPCRPLAGFVRTLACLTVGIMVAAGCSGGDEAAESGSQATGPALEGGQESVLTDSWVYYVVEDPSRLGPFEQGASGDAWLSMFHNDLRPAVQKLTGLCTPSEAPLSARAAAGYPCVGLARNHLEIAEMFAGAADIERVARRRFYQHRNANAGEVLPSEHQEYFEGVVLLASGEASGKAKLDAYAAREGADPALAALAGTISAGWGSDPLIDRLWGSASSDAPSDATLGDIPASDAASAYLARLKLAVAVAKGDVEGARGLLREATANRPDFSETLAQRDGSVSSQVELAHGDPVLQRALARLSALQAVQAIGGAADLGVLEARANVVLGRATEAAPVVPSVADGLALVLFSTAMTPADLLDGADSPALNRIAGSFQEVGVAPTKELSDLDAFVGVSNNLRATVMDLMKGTSEGAASLVADMGLGDRFMSRLMHERAGQYTRSFAVSMEAEDPADVATAGVAVRSLLEHALDKNPSPPSMQLKRARISFRNDPPSLVALARANLDTRRPYDANEYIRPLTEVYPELIPVREALAALDSAWNPARKGSVR